MLMKWMFCNVRGMNKRYKQKEIKLLLQNKVSLAGLVETRCNDLFSRFEQQTSILEKLVETTDPTTDRHGHDEPSQGLVSKNLENLKLGTENRLSELRNGMAGRIVTDPSEKLSL